MKADLWMEMLLKTAVKGGIDIRFPQLEGVDSNKLLESKSYVALQEIKRIIEDESLEDSECFEKIERIVCLFEALGSDGGNRHDPG